MVKAKREGGERGWKRNESRKKDLRNVRNRSQILTNSIVTLNGGAGDLAIFIFFLWIWFYVASKRAT